MPQSIKILVLPLETIVELPLEPLAKTAYFILGNHPHHKWIQNGKIVS